MNDSSVKEVPCKVCGLPMKVSTKSLGGTCSTCVLSGRAIFNKQKPPKVEDVPVQEEPKVEPAVLAEQPTVAPPVVSEEPKVETTIPESVEPEAQTVKVEESTSVEEPTKPKKQRKVQPKEKKDSTYGDRTAKVNELLKKFSKTKEIVAELQKEFPSVDPIDLRNLVYVQRYRAGKK